MIDSNDRKNPRFPESTVTVVETLIAQQLVDWQFGPGDLAICGGACGADLIFADASHRRGIQVKMILALPKDEFLERSVRRPGSTRDWEGLFERLSADTVRCEVISPGSDIRPGFGDGNAFARANRSILGTALASASLVPLYAILVWDERPTGDGAGGTSHFESELRGLDAIVRVINPTHLQTSAERKHP
jgi:hypothetical protein